MCVRIIKVGNNENSTTDKEKDDESRSYVHCFCSCLCKIGFFNRFSSGENLKKIVWKKGVAQSRDGVVFVLMFRNIHATLPAFVCAI